MLGLALAAEWAGRIGLELLHQQQEVEEQGVEEQGVEQEERTETLWTS